MRLAYSHTQVVIYLVAHGSSAPPPIPHVYFQSLGGNLHLSQSEVGGEVKCVLSLPVCDVVELLPTPTLAERCDDDIESALCRAPVNDVSSNNSTDTLESPIAVAPPVETAESLRAARLCDAPSFHATDKQQVIGHLHLPSAHNADPPAESQPQVIVGSVTAGAQPQLMRVLTVDDSKLINRLYRRRLPVLLGVPETNVRVLGSEQEVRNAVDEIFAFQPDVVVLDQNIDFVASTGMCYLGTKIAHELRARGFVGLVCLCTADASVESIEVSSGFKQKDDASESQCQHSTIDLILEKSDVAQMAAAVLRAHCARHAAAAAPPSSSPKAVKERRGRVRSAAAAPPSSSPKDVNERRVRVRSAALAQGRK